MNKLHQKLIDAFRKPAPLLSFGLICGCAYFMIVFRFITAYTLHANLLSFFFAPAIICGGAFIVIKSIKKSLESPNPKTGILILFYGNLWIIAIAILILILLISGINIK